MNSSKRLSALSFLALLGLLISILLSSHFYGLKNGTTDFKSYCNISEKLNCDVVAASPYSELGFGIPLSSFGAGWYLALFILSLMARAESPAGREAKRFLKLAGTLGLSITFYYFFVMAFVLKTFCLNCLLLDGIGILFFFLSLGLVSGFKPENQEHYKTFGLILAGSLFVTVLGLKGLETSSLPRSEAETQVNYLFAAKRETIQVDANLPFIGNPNARVTIVEFSDFQCPFCKMGALGLHSVLQRYPNDVKIVFRNFPLDSGCNRKMDRSMHPMACEAARLATCAHQAGQFSAVYEYLFEHQEKLSSKTPTSLLSEMKLDSGTQEKLKSCVADEASMARIKADIEEGITLGIDSTPTFFINGIRVGGALPPPVWNGLVEKLLSSP